MKYLYPDDGGLREPVRPFKGTTSAFEVLRRHFLKQSAHVVMTKKNLDRLGKNP